MEEAGQFELWQVLVLAVVQGITEFLPVSSDGHLAIVEPLIWRKGSSPPASLDLTIVLHLGTLASILVFFRLPIASMLAKDRRVLGLILLGTLPAVAVVLVCKIALDEAFEAALKSPLLAGFMLPVTGFSLLWAQRRSAGVRDYHQLTNGETLLIGAAQAAAILPGLSRSGSTIAAGLGLGLSRSAAATYSFLLAIPALAGAGIYEGVKALGRETAASTSSANLAIGAAVAFAVGLVALSLLRRVVERGRLHYFGWYCVVLGVVVIARHWPR